MGALNVRYIIFPKATLCSAFFPSPIRAQLEAANFRELGQNLHLKGIVQLYLGEQSS
jgi:hypothetical protein